MPTPQSGWCRGGLYTRTDRAKPFFSDPVTLSWLDLARMMVVLSDNAAADVILGALGLNEIDSAIGDFGLTSTRVVGGTAALQRQIIHDAGTLTLPEAVGLFWPATTLFTTALRSTRPTPWRRALRTSTPCCARYGPTRLPPRTAAK